MNGFVYLLNRMFAWITFSCNIMTQLSLMYAGHTRQTGKGEISGIEIQKYMFYNTQCALFG